MEGAEPGPTGYVEGIYVEPAYRKRSIAAELIQAGEQWAQGKGCSQVASDVELDNQTSYDFHMKTGFREANRIICLIKDI